MITAFCDATIIDNEQLVGLTNGAQAASDYKAGAPHHQPE